MNTNSPLHPFANRLQDDAPEAVQTATGHASQTAKDALNMASDTAKDLYQNVRAKADDTAVATSEYVRQHPMPSVLGAIALGVGLGYLLALSARHHQPSLREQYVDEPLDAARDALYAVLAPVAHRIRSGYESARGNAEKALEEAHHFDGSHAAHSLADQVRRVGSNLKFW